MKIRYFGHSAFEIIARGVRICLDPFITGNPHAEGIVTAADLAPDVVMLTHAHEDHWGDTLEIARRSGAVVIANFEITQYARKHGHENVLPMNTGGTITLPWGRVTQTYARHSSSFPDGTYGGNPNGYLIESEEKCVYALGDTAAFAEMEWIGRDYEVDIAFMPIGDGFTMGPRESIRAMSMIRPSVTIPVHYNTFPAIEVDIDQWEEMAGSEGYVVNVLSPGEVLDL